MNEQSAAVTSVPHLLNRVRSLAAAERRRAEGCFWAEGVRNFVHAYDARWPFELIVYSPILLQSDLADMLARKLRRGGVKCVRVTPEQFRSISVAERASGIGAILRQKWTPLNQLDPRAGLCLLVVEQIRSPGNLGTILRTADACGVGGVIFVGPASDPFDPAVVRASMGGLLHLTLVRTSADELAQWAAAHNVNLIGLSPEGGCLWTDVSLNPPVALALGEERHGLSDRVRELCGQTARLPMNGKADSLNVSIAGGVMLYELMRRKR